MDEAGHARRARHSGDTAHVVARIGKPHGLRGEVTVQLHTDDPTRRLAPGAVLATRDKPGSGGPRQLTVRTTRVHRGIWLVAFEEVLDRSAAESLRGARLVPDDEDQTSSGREAEEGWYPDELRGLAVVARDRGPIGHVTGLQLGSAQDLLVVALDTGGTAYLPFVEAIVPEVDVEGGRVVVDPPAGLLELNG